MTLIAGFKFPASGVVLCADTREEAADVKHRVGKLDSFVSDSCCVSFAGAGDLGDIVDAVVDRIKTYLANTEPETSIAIKDTIDLALVSIYETNLKAFPQPPPPLDPIDTNVQLVIAIKGKQDHTAELLLANGTVVRPVIDPPYEVRGSGERMRFIAERLYQDDLSLLQGVLLCTYLLGLSKKYVSGVGGESHIFVLRNDGMLESARLVETELSEEFFEKLDEASREIFHSYADTTLTDEQFEGKFDHFAANVKGLRSRYVRQFQQLVMGLVKTDPDFKHAYQKLTDGTRVVFENVAWRYRYREGVSGFSGYPEPSPAPPDEECGYAEIAPPDYADVGTRFRLIAPEELRLQLRQWDAQKSRELFERVRQDDWEFYCRLLDKFGLDSSLFLNEVIQ